MTIIACINCILLSLLKLTQGGTVKKLYEEHHVVQDMMLPINKLSDCIDVFHNEIKVRLSILFCCRSKTIYHPR